MHSFNVVHRDLKFENVLFMSKAPESEVMIIDFGLAKANYARKKKLDEFVGTIYSMAPEVIRGAYDAKCDVWSLGVITYMLLAGAMPRARGVLRRGTAGTAGRPAGAAASRAP